MLSKTLQMFSIVFINPCLLKDLILTTRILLLRNWTLSYHRQPFKKSPFLCLRVAKYLPWAHLYTLVHTLQHDSNMRRCRRAHKILKFQSAINFLVNNAIWDGGRTAKHNVGQITLSQTAVTPRASRAPKPAPLKTNVCTQFFHLSFP